MILLFRSQPGTDILVPPFEDWEKNPELADKYTGLFQIIGDSRKTPGTPIEFPVEPNTNKGKPKFKVSQLALVDVLH